MGGPAWYTAHGIPTARQALLFRRCQRTAMNAGLSPGWRAFLLRGLHDHWDDIELDRQRSQSLADPTDMTAPPKHRQLALLPAAIDQDARDRPLRHLFRLQAFRKPNMNLTDQAAHQGGQCCVLVYWGGDLVDEVRYVPVDKDTGEKLCATCLVPCADGTGGICGKQNTFGNVVNSHLRKTHKLTDETAQWLPAPPGPSAAPMTVTSAHVYHHQNRGPTHDLNASRRSLGSRDVEVLRIWVPGENTVQQLRNFAAKWPRDMIVEELVVQRDAPMTDGRYLRITYVPDRVPCRAFLKWLSREIPHQVDETMASPVTQQQASDQGDAPPPPDGQLQTGQTYLLQPQPSTQSGHPITRDDIARALRAELDYEVGFDTVRRLVDIFNGARHAVVQFVRQAGYSCSETELLTMAAAMQDAPVHPPSDADGEPPSLGDLLDSKEGPLPAGDRQGHLAAAAAGEQGGHYVTPARDVFEFVKAKDGRRREIHDARSHKSVNMASSSAAEQPSAAAAAAGDAAPADFLISPLPTVPAADGRRVHQVPLLPAHHHIQGFHRHWQPYPHLSALSSDAQGIAAQGHMASQPSHVYAPATGHSNNAPHSPVSEAQVMAEDSPPLQHPLGQNDLRYSPPHFNGAAPVIRQQQCDGAFMQHFPGVHWQCWWPRHTHQPTSMGLQPIRLPRHHKPVCAMGEAGDRPQLSWHRPRNSPMFSGCSGVDAEGERGRGDDSN
ncbi:unnamed protein product [Vitrella brassicaformis CCMP3155]|uniref:Uncharacterized protein n=1 Tax=Vitrella brassicaformis (strain CCMP3155) TaxID=1169540 RepID=A0A0G4GEQ6_VITBC|nr:unnamed protein product [Vitrella brassicaformis CCMP3155]|eukprot:CEM27871.1 unnamed protein product [Vitrella brassicaformis CCMP3155]